jgi:hypothetical protein
VFIGPGFTARQKRKIADELIEVMVGEAVDGRGLYGKRRRKFPKYSKKYYKYPDPVDLTLQGDMLEAIELLDTTDDSLVIGFKDGTEENAKADGNIRGTYGKQRPRPGKARPFLGVTIKEVSEVLDSYERRKRRNR